MDPITCTSQATGKLENVIRLAGEGGQPLERGLQEALDHAIASLPIPKVMSYASPNGYYNDEKFVRPAHRLIALHGTEVGQRHNAWPARRCDDPGPPIPDEGAN